MYLIQSNIYELLAVQSKNGFPFSDCLISIDTKISIVLCSRISFFLFTPRQSSDNPFDSSCEPLAYNIVYSMDYWWPVSLKTVCVCVYLHWTWGWGPHWGLLWLPHVPSFHLHQIYWQNMDKPPGSIYSAPDLLGFPMKRTSILIMTDLEEHGIRIENISCMLSGAMPLT